MNRSPIIHDQRGSDGHSIAGDAQLGMRWQELSAARTDTGDLARPPPAAAGPQAQETHADAPETGLYSRFEQVAPAVIFSAIAICIGADFLGDVVRGQSAPHLVGMAVGTVLSLGGLAIVMRLLMRSRALSRELATALDRTRADAMHWKDQAGQVLQGLGVLIDNQFSEWGLSPSEREVGLLLLKGLSLKGIAAVRKASEATVRQQAQAIYRKASLAGRAELSAFFLEDLLLPQESSGRDDTRAECSAAGRRARVSSE